MNKGTTMIVLVILALSIFGAVYFLSDYRSSSGSSFQSADSGSITMSNSTLYSNGTFLFVLGNPTGSQVDIVSLTVRPAWNNSAAQNCPTCSAPQISYAGNNTAPISNVVTSSTASGAANVVSSGISISSSNLLPISAKSFQSEECILTSGSVRVGGEYVYVIDLSNGQTVSGNLVGIT